MKRLIINADDFGLLPEVNQAIIDSYRAGSLSSTTLMVNMPAVSHALDLLRGSPGLGVGLHCNLTCGFPVSAPHQVPSLIDKTGQFWRRSQFFRRWLTGSLFIREIEREIEAQFARFAALGLDMTHVDSHQHIHMIPGVFRVVSRLAADTATPIRIPVVSDLGGRQRPGGRWFKKFILHFWTQLARRSARTSSNDHFLSIWDILPFPQPIRYEHYTELLDRVGHGTTELMVHPAYISRDLYALSDIVSISQQETAILLENSLVDAARKRGIEVINYAQLRAGSPGS